MASRYALIVAGGTGTRMGSSTPKQFLTLGNGPIIFHTIQAFQKAVPDVNFVLVLHPDTLEMWNDLVHQFQFSFSGALVPGGQSRFQSVSFGLKHIPEDSIVAVHDAVRPFPGTRLIQEAFQKAEQGNGVIPVLKLKDSIRQMHNDHSHPANRDMFRLVQTPQIFPASLLKEAYEFIRFIDPLGEEFTDDAMVFEKSGYPLSLIEGEYANIKITTPDDMIIARAWYEHFNQS